MSSSLRRGAVAATVIALSTLSLGACGAGFNAQTSGVRPDNASVTVDDIKIQNVNIVTSADGEGPAAVTAHLFNDGQEPETLRSITLDGVGEVALTPARGGDLVVPAGGSLVLGGEGNASAQLADASDLVDGNAQATSFELSGTGTLELRATVVPATGAYEAWGPTAQPSPSPPAQQPETDEEAEPGQGEEDGATGAATPAGNESPGADAPGADAETTPAG